LSFFAGAQNFISETPVIGQPDCFIAEVCIGRLMCFGFAPAENGEYYYEFPEEANVIIREQCDSWGTGHYNDRAHPGSTS